MSLAKDPGGVIHRGRPITALKLPIVRPIVNPFLTQFVTVIINGLIVIPRHRKRCRYQPLTVQVVGCPPLTGHLLVLLFHGISFGRPISLFIHPGSAVP